METQDETKLVGFVKQVKIVDKDGTTKYVQRRGRGTFFFIPFRKIGQLIEKLLNVARKVGWKTEEAEAEKKIGELNSKIEEMQVTILNLRSKNDNTSLLFKVQSMSSSAIYAGLYASAKLNMTVPGLSIVPSSLTIEAIGPHGTTGDYAFNIVSNSAPPGTYGYVISLYSKDNQLIQQISEQITVTGS